MAARCHPIAKAAEPSASRIRVRRSGEVTDIRRFPLGQRRGTRNLTAGSAGTVNAASGVGPSRRIWAKNLGAGSDRRRAVAAAADSEQPNQSITPPMGRISASTSCGIDLAEPLIAGDQDRPVRHDGVGGKAWHGRANPWQPRYRSRIWTSQRQSATPLVWSPERPVYQRRRPRTHPTNRITFCPEPRRVAKIATAARE